MWSILAIIYVHLQILLPTVNFTDVEKEDEDDNENVVKEGEVEEEEGEDEDEGEEGEEEEDADDDDDDEEEEDEDEEGDNQKRYDFRKRKTVDRYQAPQKGRLLYGSGNNKKIGFIRASSALQKMCLSSWCFLVLFPLDPISNHVPCALPEPKETRKRSLYFKGHPSPTRRRFRFNTNAPRSPYSRRRSSRLVF